jgi:hypothetical protein
MLRFSHMCHQTILYVQSTDHQLIPQGMLVLRQCKVPQAKVMFVAIQRDNIRPSKKEMNKAVTMLTAQCLQLGYESLRLLIADQ